MVHTVTALKSKQTVQRCLHKQESHVKYKESVFGQGRRNSEGRPSPHTGYGLTRVIWFFCQHTWAVIRDWLHVAATKTYPDTVLHPILPVVGWSSPAIISVNITLCPFVFLSFSPDGPCCHHLARPRSCSSTAGTNLFLASSWRMKVTDVTLLKQIIQPSLPLKSYPSFKAHLTSSLFLDYPNWWWAVEMSLIPTRLWVWSVLSCFSLHADSHGVSNVHAPFWKALGKKSPEWGHDTVTPCRLWLLFLSRVWKGCEPLLKKLPAFLPWARSYVVSEVLLEFFLEFSLWVY